MNILLEDCRTHREGLLALGFWALLVYRFGHARFVIRNKWLRLPWTIVYLILEKFVEIVTGIVIPSTVVIGRRLEIEHHGCIILHGNVVVGDDCKFRHDVTIGNSGYADKTGAPRIGNRVEIGAGARILGRITVEDDVIIGANAVVVRSLPAGAVAVGIPARVVRIREAPASPN